MRTAGLYLRLVMNKALYLKASNREGPGLICRTYWFASLPLPYFTVFPLNLLDGTEHV